MSTAQTFGESGFEEGVRSSWNDSMDTAFGISSASAQLPSPGEKMLFGKCFGFGLDGGAGTEPFKNGATERFYPGLRTLYKAFRLRKRRLNPKGTLHRLQICKRFL